MSAPRARRTAIAIATAGIALSLMGCGGGGSSKATTANTSASSAKTGDTSQNSSASTLADPAAGSAMATWLKAQDSEGTNNSDKLTNFKKDDIDKTASDMSKPHDAVTAGNDCGALSGDANGLPTDSPDATVNTNLEKAAKSFRDASNDCGLDDKKFLAEFNQGVDSFNLATARIGALTSNAGGTATPSAASSGTADPFLTSDLPDSATSTMAIWLRATEDPENDPEGPTHQEVLASVQADFVKVRDDFSKHADPATDVHDCAALGTDIASLPDNTPDTMVSQNMGNAATNRNDASKNCGTDDSTFAGQLNRGIDYFNLAVARIKSLTN